VERSWQSEKKASKGFRKELRGLHGRREPRMCHPGKKTGGCGLSSFKGSVKGRNENGKSEGVNELGDPGPSGQRG